MFTEKLLQGAGSTTTSSVTDPYFDNVSLLVSGDSWDSSPTPKQITPNGNATVSTTQKKYGSGSWYFDGSGDNITAAANSEFLLNADFTVEGWVYPLTPVQSYQAVFTVGGAYGSEAIHLYLYHTSYSTGYLLNITGTQIFTGTLTIPKNTWHHFALVRYGNNLTLYVNGSVDKAVTYPTLIYTSNPAFCLGSETATRGITDFTGYIDDFRLTKGVARYTANFTPPITTLPTTTDPYWNNVSLLLKGNSWDTGPSAKAITLNGNARTDITTKKYGSGSWYFDGTGDYLSIPSSTDFAFGTGDYTIELWFYPLSMSGTSIIFDLRTDNNFASRPSIGAIGTTIYYWPGSGADWFSVGSISVNTWNHLAVARSGSSLKFFINGTQTYTGTDTSTLTTGTCFIGGYWNQSLYSNGYIDDVRVTKGIARYTANFTPPSAAYYQGLSDETTYNTVLLLNGNGTNGSTVIRDSSPARNPITVNGNVQISTVDKKYGTGSLYFDGSGDYLTLPTITLNGDFTIEGWFYKTAAVSSFMIFASPGAADPWIGWYSNNTTLYVGASTNTYAIPNTTNSWAHIAMVRSSNSLRVFVNGVESSTGSKTWTSPLTLSYIGSYGTSSWFYTGYIDDFRITDGIARYAANFTPPTAELTP